MILGTVLGRAAVDDLAARLSWLSLLAGVTVLSYVGFRLYLINMDSLRESRSRGEGLRWGRLDPEEYTRLRTLHDAAMQDRRRALMRSAKLAAGLIGLGVGLILARSEQLRQQGLSLADIVV